MRQAALAKVRRYVERHGLRLVRQAARLGPQELLLLLLLALIAAGIWFFVAVADEVLEGETRAVDMAILLALRQPDDRHEPLGPPFVEEIGRDITALGSHVVLGFVTLATVGFLLLQGKRRAAMLVLVAVVGGMLVSSLLKLGFDRPRPDVVPHGAMVYTASFPSGHSMLSAVVYLTLGALLARVQSGRRLKTYLMLLAVLLTVAVGISRIYLGVHWPSDVLAGWTAGAVWALICWVLALWLQRRGNVESGDHVNAR